jgi:hypothetical protein
VGPADALIRAWAGADRLARRVAGRSRIKLDRFPGGDVDGLSVSHLPCATGLVGRRPDDPCRWGMYASRPVVWTRR